MTLPETINHIERMIGSSAVVFNEPQRPPHPDHVVYMAGLSSILKDLTIASLLKDLKEGKKAIRILKGSNTTDIVVVEKDWSRAI